MPERQPQVRFEVQVALNLLSIVCCIRLFSLLLCHIDRLASRCISIPFKLGSSHCELRTKQIIEIEYFKNA